MEREFALADTLDLRVVMAGATATTPIPGGVVVRNADLPAVRFLNVVCLVGPLEPGFGAAQLAALADLQLGGLTHRALRISDEASAERVAPDLIAAGWERRRTVLMVRPGGASIPLPEPDARAREAGEAEHTALMGAVFAETDYGSEAPSGLPALLVAAQRAQQAGTTCRRFAAGENGGLQSMCELFLDADVDGVPMAMVEQVATLRAHRERGLGKAVVVAALAAAIDWGARLIMVPADREDWPQIIYAGLGCETVGTVTSFFAPVSFAAGRP